MELVIFLSYKSFVWSHSERQVVLRTYIIRGFQTLNLLARGRLLEGKETQPQLSKIQDTIYFRFVKKYSTYLICTNIFYHIYSKIFLKNQEFSFSF